MAGIRIFLPTLALKIGYQVIYDNVGPVAIPNAFPWTKHSSSSDSPESTRLIASEKARDGKLTPTSKD